MARKKKLTHLTEEEMNILIKAGEDEADRKTAERIMDLTLIALQKDIEIAQLKVEVQRERKSNQRTVHGAVRSAHKGYVTELREKYEVTTLGYDPLTREIFRE